MHRCNCIARPFESQDMIQAASRLTRNVCGADASDEVFWRELPAALRTDMAMELAGPIFKHRCPSPDISHASKLHDTLILIRHVACNAVSGLREGQTGVWSGGRRRPASGRPEAGCVAAATSSRRWTTPARAWWLPG